MSEERDDEVALLRFDKSNSRLTRRGPTFYDTDISPHRATDSVDDAIGEAEPHGFFDDGGQGRDGDLFLIESADPCLPLQEASPVRGEPASCPEASAHTVTQPPLAAPFSSKASQSLRPTLPTTVRQKTSGLAMRDLVADGFHCWLLRQEPNQPVRVRMFQTVDAFANSMDEMELETLAHKRRRAHRRSRSSRTTPQMESISHSVTRSANVRLPDAPAQDADSVASMCSSATRSSLHRTNAASSKHSRGGSSWNSGSSSSSSISADSDDGEDDVFWLDVQSDNPDDVNHLAELFGWDDNIVEKIMNPVHVDHVDYFPTTNYVVVNIGCLSLHRDTAAELINAQCRLIRRGSFVSVSTVPPSTAAQGQADIGFGVHHRMPDVVVSCVVGPKWIVTLHTSPFEELVDLVKQVQMEFTIKKKSHSAAATKAATSGSGGEKNDTKRHHRHHVKRTMYPSWVLSTLVDFVVTNTLPDPAPLLRHIDQIESEVMLFATGCVDTSIPITTKISHLRRSVMRFRRLISGKERLAMLMQQPSMRSSHVCKRPSDTDTYTYCHNQIVLVAERVDSARDILNAAQSNLAAAEHLHMAQSGHQLENRMQLMGGLAAAFMPPSLVAGLFGMNIRVPYMNNFGWTELTAFYVIIGCAAAWLCLVGIPLLLWFWNSQRHSQTTAYNSSMLKVALMDN